MQSVFGSGRRELLPVSSPLRTVRASFPAYGSSFYKAPISRHPALRDISRLEGPVLPLLLLYPRNMDDLLRRMDSCLS